MKPDPARLVRWFMAAVAAMLVGLAGLGAFVHSAVGRIDEASRSIADNTAPSIVALESVSVALSRLHHSLAGHLRASDDAAASPAQIAAERSALAESAARYFALPIDAGEQEIMDEIRVALGRLDHVADRILAVGPDTAPRDRDVIKVDLDAVKGAIEGEIMKAFDLNADLAYAATGELRGVERRLLPGLLIFMVVCGLAAVVALGVAYRVSRTEAALTERWLLTRKNAELEAFSARVAHDLVTPLTTVTLSVGLAQQRLSASGNEQIGAALSRAGGALQRIHEMISDLLEFARAAAPPPTGVTTEVASYVEALVGDLQPIASEAHVDLALTSVCRRSVACAAGILSSLLSNLIQNAIRYTGKEAERHVDVRVIDAGPDVRFEVEDTGPGIPPEDRERIFEPFVRRATDGPGLGLGLATVKRLAESHGGHVGVRPAPGHGSLFWVTLPAAPASLRASPPVGDQGC